MKINLARPLHGPDLAWAASNRIVSSEGWELEQLSHWTLVYRAGPITAESTTEDMLPRDRPSFAVVYPPEFEGTPEVAALTPADREQIFERILRGARAFHGYVERFVPSKGWRVESPTRAVSLDDGSVVELHDDAVVVHGADRVAEVRVLRRRGRELELATRSLRLGGWDEGAVWSLTALGLNALGYSSTLCPE